VPVVLSWAKRLPTPCRVLRIDVRALLPSVRNPLPRSGCRRDARDERYGRYHGGEQTPKRASHRKIPLLTVSIISRLPRVVDKAHVLMLCFVGELEPLRLQKSQSRRTSMSGRSPKRLSRGGASDCGCRRPWREKGRAHRPRLRLYGRARDSRSSCAACCSDDDRHTARNCSCEDGEDENPGWGH
jgi:hypothetical protein